MKELIFLIYAFFFNLRALFLPNKRLVALVSMHNANFTDSLFEVEREMSKRKCGSKSYKFLKVSRPRLSNIGAAIKFCTVDAFRLGGASYIFLNDNFMPLGYLRPQASTKIVQLWHGQGVFKKFGLHINVDENVRKRELSADKKLTYVVCSSENVKDIYATAFGVSPEKVIATGTPNEDFYFRSNDLQMIREDFDNRYESCKNKKLVLYAPTFRGNTEEDSLILENFDATRLRLALEKVWNSPVEVLVRLHPQVHTATTSIDAVNVTDYESINNLCLISDLLITDYSSVCMDFSLLKKPMIFYAYDLCKYKADRDFYFDYETYVPGPVAKNMDELIAIAAENNFAMEKNEKFRSFNFGAPDGHATEKLIDFLI